jgi:2-hydroxychromene-2-carboxylate isomerase
VRNAGTWAANFARAALVNAVNESQLESAEKKAIVAQIDRVVEQYKAGQITNVDLQRILEELGQSPLMGALIVYGIETKYVQTSGLSDAEKAAARLSLQRVLRGLHEKKIVLQALDAALDKVCRKDSAGNRQLKERVTDQELREFVAACRAEADKAGVPDEPYLVKASDEIRKAIDRALQTRNAPDE